MLTVGASKKELRVRNTSSVQTLDDVQRVAHLPFSRQSRASSPPMALTVAVENVAPKAVADGIHCAGVGRK